MIGIDAIIAFSTVTLLIDFFKSKRTAKKFKSLEKENLSIKEVVASLMDQDNGEPLYDHSWNDTTDDVVYKSINPLSNDVVVARTAVCSKCQMIHRYVINGSLVAKKKNLDIDGFFLSGVRITDLGCRVKS